MDNVDIAQWVSVGVALLIGIVGIRLSLQASKRSADANATAAKALNIRERRYLDESASSAYPSSWSQDGREITVVVTTTTQITDVLIEFRHYTGAGGSVQLDSLNEDIHSYLIANFVGETDLEKSGDATAVRSRVSWSTTSSDERLSSGIRECNKQMRKFQPVSY